MFQGGTVWLFFDQNVFKLLGTYLYLKVGTSMLNNMDFGFSELYVFESLIFQIKF